jgi:hypothetical protein
MPSYTARDAVIDSENSLIVQGLIDISKSGFPEWNAIKTNHFVENTLDKIGSFIPGNDPAKDQELRNYIAASTFIHAFDSWNYISRGVESILQGDINTAIHLLYYSEVRSVMSILASSGIGIFRNRHCFLDNAGDFQLFGKSTHDVIDKCIKEFETGSNSKLRSFLACVKFDGISLEEFIDHSGVESSGELTSKYFIGRLATWSIDLKLEEDQQERNNTSYRPNFYREKVAKTLVASLTEIWRELEPNGSLSFEKIDRYIGLSTMNSLIDGGRMKKLKTIQKTLEYFADPAYCTKIMKDLNKRKIHKPLIFRLAEKDKNNRSINFSNPLPMLCRSILLARIATGLVEKNVRDPKFNRTGLDGWWKDTAIKLGIIGGKSKQSSIDLWADVEDSLDNLELDKFKNFRIKQLNNAKPNELLVLSQFQRVALWGLGT